MPNPKIHGKIIGVKIPDELLAKLDRQTKATGKSRAQIIRELLEVL